MPEVVRQGVDSSLAHGFWNTKERVLQCFVKWIPSGKQKKIQDLQRYAFSIDNMDMRKTSKMCNNALLNRLPIPTFLCYKDCDLLIIEVII